MPCITSLRRVEAECRKALTITRLDQTGDHVNLDFELRCIDGSVMSGQRIFQRTDTFASAQELLEVLWSGDLFTAEGPQEAPEMNLIWVVPPLLIASLLSFGLHIIWDIGVGPSAAPYSFAIIAVALVCGARHAILLSLASGLAHNYLVVDPNFTLTLPTSSEDLLAALWVAVSLAVPVIVSRLESIRAWILAFDQKLKQMQRVKAKG